MTCKNCLHYEVYAEDGLYFTDEYIKGITTNNDVRSLCSRFKDKNDYIKAKMEHINRE